MSQKADHPHQAAVHLIKSLRCCKDCYNTTQAQYSEVAQLHSQKQSLLRQLHSIGNPQPDLQIVKAQIHDLQFLIARVTEENEAAYRLGETQVERIGRERQVYQKQIHEGYQVEIVAERERNRMLASEIDKQMQKIRYLHRINQQLVNRFVKY